MVVRIIGTQALPDLSPCLSLPPLLALLDGYFDVLGSIEFRSVNFVRLAAEKSSMWLV